MSSYSRGFHFAINCWQSIVVCYLVPGPVPCPEVVTVSYIRLAEVLTLSSVERDAQVKQKNHEHRFLTRNAIKQAQELLTRLPSRFTPYNVRGKVWLKA